MTVKRVAILFGASVALSPLLANSASARPTPPAQVTPPFVAHNHVVSPSYGGCVVRFAHGNLFGGARASISIGRGGPCASGTYVEAHAFGVRRSRCYLLQGPSRSCVSNTLAGRRWMTAIIPPYHSLLLSKVRICSPRAGCDRALTYRAI